MPDLGRWTSIDPLAEKFYNENPYHMAGNNPIVFMDYNGEDYILTINWDTGVITVSGTLYATKEDSKAANKAAKNWNKQSGNFKYSFTGEDGNKKDLTINYNINVKEVEVGKGDTKVGALNKAISSDESGGANAFNVVADSDLPSNTNGRTQTNYIRVKDSKKDDDTSTHEVGHALGVPHSSKGVMTPSSTDPNRTSNVNRTNIQNTVRNPIRGKTYTDGRGKATIQTKATGAGVKPPSTKKGKKRFKNGKVKKNG